MRHSGSSQPRPEQDYVPFKAIIPVVRNYKFQDLFKDRVSYGGKASRSSLNATTSSTHGSKIHMSMAPVLARIMAYLGITVSITHTTGILTLAT